MQKTPEHINEICMDLLNTFWTIQIIITSICVWWWHMQKMRHSNIPTDWQLVNTDRGKTRSSQTTAAFCAFIAAPTRCQLNPQNHCTVITKNWSGKICSINDTDEINTFYSEIHIALFWNLARLSSSCFLYVLPLANTVSIQKKNWNKLFKCR